MPQGLDSTSYLAPTVEPRLKTTHPLNDTINFEDRGPFHGGGEDMWRLHGTSIVKRDAIVLIVIKIETM